MSARRWTLAVAVLALVVAACSDDDTAAPEPTTTEPASELTVVKDATEGLAEPAAAEAAGYGELLDVDGIACIEQPGEGAMGVHYVKQELVGDTELDPEAPEALVYAPAPDGSRSLAAVEYVVLQEPWDATHTAPPELFGEAFMLTPAPNRFGLPAFYALHAWAWKANPDGDFAMWNPDVACSW